MNQLPVHIKIEFVTTKLCVSTKISNGKQANYLYYFDMLKYLNLLLTINYST